MTTQHKKQGNDSPIVIKKYANRRLYNTASSSYITLDDIAQIVRDEIEFSVIDAKSGEDLTRSVLTQIIVEQEAKTGQNLLPISFLRRLISLYGDNMQWLVPGYLESTMHNFTQNQERVREYVMETFGEFSPLEQFEKMSQQNAQIFENAMQMFSPFSSSSSSKKTAQQDNGLSDIESKLENLQKELDKIRNKKD